MFRRILFAVMVLGAISLNPFPSGLNAAPPADSGPRGDTQALVQAAPLYAIVRVTHTTADMHPSVQCPDGYKVVGGGFQGTETALVYHSFKKFNGWQIKAKPYSITWPNLTVYATCLQWTRPITYHKHSILINSLQTDSTAANCDSGEVAIGGGYKVNDSRALIYKNVPGAHKWSARARNQAGDARTLTVLVICGPEFFTNQNIVSRAVSVPPGTTKSANQLCPSSLFSVMSGGFDAEAIYWRVSSFPKNDETWRVTVRNDHTPNTVLYTIYANCFEFA